MNNWKEIVGQVAPVLGTALGGPFAGTAVKFLTDAFLDDDEQAELADPNKNITAEQLLSQHLTSAGPETLVLLKELDLEFEVQMAEIGLQKEQLRAKDREDARSLAENTTLWPQIILAAVFILGYFSMLGYLLYSAVEGGLEQLPQSVLILLGVMTGAIPQILNFFYGTTKGSSDKNKLVENLMVRLRAR